MRTLSRRAALAALTPLLVASACIHRPAAVRLVSPTPIAVAVLVDRDQAWSQTAPDAPPDELLSALNGALDERNLVARLPADEARTALLTARETRQRLQRLSELTRGANEARLLLLAETKVVFYELLSGRYKWNVFARFTVARRDDLSAAATVEADFPVFLLYDHEREAEALRAAADRLADRAGRLVDEVLRGRADFPTEPRALESSADAPGAAPTARALAAGEALGPIYFVMVDRFANGDRANDADANPTDPQGFHGGDLQGVVDRLDYLQQLGVRTVWLSPVFQMRTRPFFGHGAFHGYWVEDYSRIEPRFGDAALLRKLSDALHARGMKLLLDVVLNHVAMDAPLVRQRPEWFHGEGPITDWNDAAQLETHDVHGLPDLAQERDDVYRHLIGNSLRWIDEVRPDGFRLDAVKHVPLAFWRRFNAEVKAHAGPGFFLLGEALDGDPEKLATLRREGGFDALFDFPLRYALADAFCRGRPLQHLGAILSLDSLHADPGAQLVTLLDNHDLPRLSSECGGDLQRAGLALDALFALRGVPSLQYGTEVGLTGKAEPESRGDMRFVEHPLRARIARLAALRREHPALERGATRLLWVGPRQLGLLRAAEHDAVLVAINLDDAAAEPPAPAWRAFAPSVPAHSVLVVPIPLHRNQNDGIAQLAEQRTRPVEIAVSGAPLGPGEQVFVVGAGPALGSWDPRRALGPAAPSVHLQPAASTVLEYKLVIKKRDGSFRWEESDDRFLFVDSGKSPLRVVAAWRGA